MQREDQQNTGTVVPGNGGCLVLPHFSKVNETLCCWSMKGSLPLFSLSAPKTEAQNECVWWLTKIGNTLWNSFSILNSGQRSALASVCTMSHTAPLNEQDDHTFMGTSFLPASHPAYLLNDWPDMWQPAPGVKTPLAFEITPSVSHTHTYFE